VQTVVLTGEDGPLGHRVRALLDADPAVTEVIPIDLAGADLAGLKRRIEGATSLVHLGRSDGADLDGTGSAGVDVAGTRALLDAAGAVGVGHLVLLSSATVYGAWPDNPVPITEEAPMRPYPGLGFATHKAEVERLAAEWRWAHPGSRVATLRGPVAVAEDRIEWLAASVWSDTAVAVADPEPPQQFVHLDDLASAVDLARRATLDGPFNVAPDGWIGGAELRRLAGNEVSVRLNARVVAKLASWRWKLGRTSTPPAIVPYRSHPWVVANDRLRSEGWAPGYSNEEAFVFSHEPSGWSTVSPQRRQEIALGAAAVGLIGVLAGLVAVLRRLLRD
jgi:nucleoside-diphosphate-sugar epimerase